MNYNLNAAINLRGKTWAQEGYAEFCTPQECILVIDFKDSINFTSEPYMDIPDCEMATVEYPDANTPKRQWYTKERWKSAWGFHRAYINEMKNL